MAKYIFVTCGVVSIHFTCEFEGFTDGVFDSETGTAQWNCEECETEYAEPRER